MSEADIQARILLACGALPGVRLFRNTVGEGWQGKVLQKTAETVTLLRPRYVTFGLYPGSGDLIGWSGGAFASVEVKDTKGAARANQERWMSAVLRAGGKAGFAKSPDDALRILSFL